jgi:hypothetical protein
LNNKLIEEIGLLEMNPIIPNRVCATEVRVSLSSVFGRGDNSNLKSPKSTYSDSD